MNNHQSGDTAITNGQRKFAVKLEWAGARKFISRYEQRFGLELESSFHVTNKDLESPGN